MQHFSLQAIILAVRKLGKNPAKTRKMFDVLNLVHPLVITSLSLALIVIYLVQDIHSTKNLVQTLNVVYLL